MSKNVKTSPEHHISCWAWGNYQRLRTNSQWNEHSGNAWYSHAQFVRSNSQASCVTVAWAELTKQLLRMQSECMVENQGVWIDLTAFTATNDHFLPILNLFFLNKRPSAVKMVNEFVFIIYLPITILVLSFKTFSEFSDSTLRPSFKQFISFQMFYFP